jgi:alpha-1,3-glucan synthase
VVWASWPSLWERTVSLLSITSSSPSPHPIKLTPFTVGHQDLIWVVPTVGGIDYPKDTPADPMDITIMGKPYQIGVQYHVLNNITYVILDAPIFRAQSKAEPYPERMDDMDSAIFYSAWNQCIALAIKRFGPDLYHINGTFPSFSTPSLLLK